MKGLCVCVNNNNNDDVNYCSLIKPKVNIGKKTITNSILLWVPRLGHKSFLCSTSTLKIFVCYFLKKKKKFLN